MQNPLDLGDEIILGNLGKLNVLLGKNGSGKSTILRQFDKFFAEGDACVRYVTPERGGELKLNGNLETNQANNDKYLPDSRRQNQYPQFRQSSVTEFRRLETMVLRAIESDQEIRSTNFTFQSEIEKINTLLDNIIIKRTASGIFEIYNKEGTEIRRPEQISSGESELISLSIEVLLFTYLCKQEEYKGKSNWLLFDEPDVHLHPDLQYRFISLLKNAIMESPDANVIIATHSTSIISALSIDKNDTLIGFKDSKSGNVSFEKITNSIKSVLPMFGAHPLSSVFNSRPIMIVEGDDEARIWSQAIRSSKGRIRAYPCVAGDIQSLNSHESAAEKFLNSVYENASAYSLRDRDGDPYEIEDLGPVKRFRLNCRASENLLLSDDVLDHLGTNWTSLQATIEKWLENNEQHSKHAAMLLFAKSEFNRMEHDIKNIRNLIVGLSGSSKPWEVAVGQAISNLPNACYHEANNLENFLGAKIVEAMSLKTP